MRDRDERPHGGESAMMRALDIDGVWSFTPRIHRDTRGSFLEWFRNSDLAHELGYELEVAQANCSVSRRGVLRGIHFAAVPPGQSKYVACVHGAVLDVVVDVREGSASFGSWEAVPLNDEARRALYISEGIGHAFMALSEWATVLYLCSTPYSPGRERGIHPLDPSIGIRWPGSAPAVLSDKDASAPSLEEARSAGLLPDYADCIAHTARLRNRSPGQGQDGQRLR